MKRKRLTKSQRLDVLHANGGLCYLCDQPINLAKGDKLEIEHPRPLALGGADDHTNWKPVHAECHKGKTKGDITIIAKSKRKAAKHEGTYRPSRNPLPCGRKSALKKKIGGRVVNRDTGEDVNKGKWK